MRRPERRDALENKTDCAKAVRWGKDVVPRFAGTDTLVSSTVWQHWRTPSVRQRTCAQRWAGKLWSCVAWARTATIKD